MEALFLRTLDLSITASYVIAAVILLRLVLKKAPRWTVCALWALVAIRLVCPFSIESALSLIPATETVRPDIFYADSPQTAGPLAAHPGTADELPVTEISPSVTSAVEGSLPAAVPPARTAAYAASLVWLLGGAAILLYGAGSYLLLRRRMSTAVRCKGNLWQSEKVTSPFVLGFFRPNIYLPFGLDNNTLTHVVAHEWAHIRRLDHWTKLIGFILLAVHWFNPLVWLAYVLLCRDIELACDEKVVRDLDKDTRREYATALLTCGMKGPRPRLAACPLAFGEVGVKTRVKGVMHYKKPAFRAIVIVLVLIAVLAVCLLTDPAAGISSESLYTDTFTDAGGIITYNVDLVLPAEEEQPAPVLQAIPRDVSVEEAQRIAYALFGDAPMYEYTEEMTKAELEEAIAYWEERLSSTDQIEAEYPKEDEAFYQWYMETYTKLLNDYKADYETASDTIEPVLSDWTFHPTFYYHNDAGQDLSDPEVMEYNSAENIMITTTLNGLPYRFNVYNRDSAEDPFHWLNAFFDDGQLPRDTIITPVPHTAADMETACETAADLLAAMGLDYEITSCTMNDEIITVKAQPRYQRTLALSVPDIAVIGEDGTPETYTDNSYAAVHAQFEFSGKNLVWFEYHAPFDVVETTATQAQLTYAGALEALELALQADTPRPMAVSYTIDQVKYGYVHVPVNDGSGRYQLVPAYAFYGEADLGYLLEDWRSVPLVVISAVDGSRIY